MTGRVTDEAAPERLRGMGRLREDESCLYSSLILMFLNQMAYP